MNKTGNSEGLKKAWAVQRAQKKKRERQRANGKQPSPPTVSAQPPGGWWKLSQLEMPARATRRERQLARQALGVMVGCMTREIRGPDARLAYTAAVRLCGEIRGGTLPSASVVTAHSDSSLTIERSPLLTQRRLVRRNWTLDNHQTNHLNKRRPSQPLSRMATTAALAPCCRRPLCPSTTG